jgi:hypothetical protein
MEVAILTLKGTSESWEKVGRQLNLPGGRWRENAGDKVDFTLG